jgi:hypothetical protein
MKVKDLSFVCSKRGEDTLYTAKGDWGRITVLNRMTGFGYRDVETGFKDKRESFWLASCNFDIRTHPELNIQEAILLIKGRANTCVPKEQDR